MDMNALIDRLKEEFQKNRMQLLLISGGVFLLTFFIILLGRCRGDKPELPINGYSLKQSVPKNHQRMITSSPHAFLDAELPLLVPNAEFNRSVRMSLPQLVRKRYSLTETELYEQQRRLRSTGTASRTGRTNRPAETSLKEEVPEIDMILNRPPKRRRKRAEY